MGEAYNLVVSICLKQNQRKRKMAAKFVFALVLLALSALAHAEEAKTLVGLVPEAQVPEAVSEMIESVTREKRQAEDEDAGFAGEDGDEEAVDDEEDEAVEVEEGDDYEEEADDDSDYVDEDEETSADEWQPVEDPAEDAPAKKSSDNFNSLYQTKTSAEDPTATAKQESQAITSIHCKHQLVSTHHLGYKGTLQCRFLKELSDIF